MGALRYSAIASLDGYVADEQGRFDWAAPDDEVHQFVNDSVRGATTHLYGRRTYEVMTAWESPEMAASPNAPTRDFAQLWQAAEKVVHSRTLDAVSTARTRLERDFDPGTVASLKESVDGDLLVGGPTLGAEAFRAGLVDEVLLVLVPVTVGGGLAALPTGLRVDLELRDERRFAGGAVHLRYGVRR